MTSFQIDYVADRSDCLSVEVDRRYEIVIERTETGLSLRVYPRTAGELWDSPFLTCEVAEAEIIALEREMDA